MPDRRHTSRETVAPQESGKAESGATPQDAGNNPPSSDPTLANADGTAAAQQQTPEQPQQVEEGERVQVGENVEEVRPAEQDPSAVLQLYSTETLDSIKSQGITDEGIAMGIADLRRALRDRTGERGDQMVRDIEERRTQTDR